MGLTPTLHLVPKVLKKSTAIPLLALRACVAYKKGETQLRQWLRERTTVLRDMYVASVVNCITIYCAYFFCFDKEDVKSSKTFL